MGQRGPKVGWTGRVGRRWARYSSGCWVSGRRLAGCLAKTKRRLRLLLLLPKWALFKLLPIRCGLPGPDRARKFCCTLRCSWRGQPETAKCRGLSKSEHKLEDSLGIRGVG